MASGADGNLVGKGGIDELMRLLRIYLRAVVPVGRGETHPEGVQVIADDNGVGFLR